MVKKNKNININNSNNNDINIETNKLSLDNNILSEEDNSLNEIDDIKTNGLYTSSFNVVLNADVVITPEQINNNLYNNIKSNLEQRLIGKCYNDEGYINKIYNINDVLNLGEIKLEDQDCNVYYNVNFTCQLIKPIIHKIILGKVNLNQTSLLTLTNGPMKIIINGENYDNELFSIDHETRTYKYNDQIIEPGDFYKVEILFYKITNKEKNIFITGKLIDIASDEEINNYYNEVYNNVNN